MTEPDTAVEALRRATRTLLDLLADVSDARFRERPPGEEWSIAETVEHVVLTDRGIRARLETIQTSPFPAGAPRFDDAAISSRMFDGVQAPPGLAEPSGRFATRDEGVAALEAACASIATWAAQTDADLRACGAPHPVFGVFDAVQWILFAAAHTDNHVPQLRRLRARADLAGA